MPSVLVVGAANFYGRAVIEQLCGSRDRAAGEAWEIRGADKVLPQLAGFPAETLALYETIDYRMGNLRSRAFLAQAFARDAGRWDVVVNVACEYKFGQAAAAYAQDVSRLAADVAELAAEHGAGALVHLSTAHVYRAGSAANAPHGEDDPVEPSNELAACHMRAEAAVRAVAALPALVVLRPALSYGPGDRQNVVPMLISAQLSRVQAQPMPVLWERDLRVSTVHVADVARACIHAGRWAGSQPAGSVRVFNLADPGDTTNARLAQAVAELFAVKPGFQNAAVNFIAKRLKTAELTEEVNESLLGPWMQLLREHGAANSPLSPYLDQEHPYCRLELCPLAVDGSAICRALDFAYAHPQVCPDALRPMVVEFQQLGLWPNIPL
ncbi:hypothetical protein IWW55_000255 [Coemansia sp. RSA 2706]|nr:hypothetical protein LPJ63_005214 [Coemansia sp. RSA 2711]KAJ2308752.1 hypothetical protein IWW55_000255 [Coemansia sp. RSA 2706]KAJ2315437.1 hypothetical protein IWW54_000278 [Coemansia sp. RSA 2705]KAJ2322329.1 hypothetical protein IWW52_000162 [Coemansia sp. RSA 2704]KAJ2329922.1 hypothetical protein IWW51_000292 [Coemansia sp. RSA 2702]KAJ2370447.1 hypothetical protein H4S01_000358 [Coemansia sp. RSA 2610]KAJ2393674.1 hypothetical protein H4S02_000036 [Coemansia sp. RSA 2611]KAJ273989